VVLAHRPRQRQASRFSGGKALSNVFLTVSKVVMRMHKLMRTDVLRRILSISSPMSFAISAKSGRFSRSCALTWRSR